MSSPSLLSAHFLPSPLPFFALSERPCRLCVHHWAAHCTLAFVPAKQRCERQWTLSALCALPEVHPQVSDCAWKTLRTQVGSIFVYRLLGRKKLLIRYYFFKCKRGNLDDRVAGRAKIICNYFSRNHLESKPNKNVAIIFIIIASVLLCL